MTITTSLDLSRRILFIDFLRGLSIFIIIWIHSLRRFIPGDMITFQIWNYLHFVVPLIIFISGVSLTISSHEKINNFYGALKWILKRTARLVIPYYFFLIIWFAIQIIINSPGYNYPNVVIKFISSLLLLGNLGGAVLIRLIFGISLFFPLLYIFHRKNKVIWLLIITAALFGLSRILENYVIKLPYTSLTLIAWLVPFSAGIAVGHYRIRLHQLYTLLAGRFVWLGIGFALLFFSVLIGQGRSLAKLVLIDHEYPPELIFFLYGGIGIFWPSALAIRLERFLYKKEKMHSIVSYFSKNSLEIFMYHYLSMEIFSVIFKQFGLFHFPAVWILYFVFVLIVAVIFAAFAKKMLTYIIKLLKVKTTYN